MLVFTLEPGAVFHIGGDVHIRIIKLAEGRVKVGIEAPRDVAVDRDKVRQSKLRETVAE